MSSLLTEHATTPGFIDSLRESGSSRFSATKLVRWLDLPVHAAASAAGVHRNTWTYHPESPRVQDFARNVMRVATVLRALDPSADDARVAFLFKNYPLDDLHHKTALELVKDGRTEDVVGYLESFRSGFVG